MCSKQKLVTNIRFKKKTKQASLITLEAESCSLRFSENLPHFKSKQTAVGDCNRLVSFKLQIKCLKRKKNQAGSEDNLQTIPLWACPTGTFFFFFFKNTISLYRRKCKSTQGAWPSDATTTVSLFLICMEKHKESASSMKASFQGFCKKAVTGSELRPTVPAFSCTVGRRCSVCCYALLRRI